MLKESLNKEKTTVLKGINILFTQKPEKHYSYTGSTILTILCLLLC